MLFCEIPKRFQDSIPLSPSNLAASILASGYYHPPSQKLGKNGAISGSNVQVSSLEMLDRKQVGDYIYLKMYLCL